MLLSTCPNCNARFRVAPEQLNVRHGHVMCGRCRHVFNAFESLKRVEDEPQQEPIDYSIVAGAASHDGAQERPTVETHSEQSPFDVATADTQTGSPVELVTEQPEPSERPRPPASPETPPPLPSSADKPVEQIDDGFDYTAKSESDSLSEFEASPVASSEQRAGETSNPDADPIVIPDSFRPPTTNPLINGKLPAQQRPSRAWRWLAVVAGSGLILQATYFYRAWIVQQLPQAGPAFTSVCELVGCVMPLARDVAAIKVESSDLVEQPGKPGRILLSAIVANRSAVKQSFPVLEVVLTDAKETVIASRVLQPATYLGRVPSQVEGIAPNTELYINLNLDLSGGATASGYAVRVFYP